MKLRKVVKWLGISAAVVVGLIAVALTGVYAVSSSKMSRTYDVQVQPVPVPTDSASLARGKHIVQTRGCNTHCHGTDLGGGTILEGPFFIGYLYGPNLTTGRGGVGAGKSDLDWVRAIRHGLTKDHRSFTIMPSDEFYYLNDEDLGALIAYLKSLPPVDREMPEPTLGPLLRVLYLAGEVTLPAEKINHNAPRPAAPPVGVTVEYGNYIAHGCTGCHGEGFSGGPMPGAPPDWTPPANITPAGNIGKWSEEQFLTMMRTGVTPEGRKLDPERMPWNVYGKMTDTELRALLMYLRALPSRASGTR